MPSVAPLCRHIFKRQSSRHFPKAENSPLLRHRFPAATDSRQQSIIKEKTQPKSVKDLGLFQSFRPPFSKGGEGLGRGAPRSHKAARVWGEEPHALIRWRGAGAEPRSFRRKSLSRLSGTNLRRGRRLTPVDSRQRPFILKKTVAVRMDCHLSKSFRPPFSKGGEGLGRAAPRSRKATGCRGREAPCSIITR